MTNKQDRAIGMALQAISLPDNDEQRLREMTEADIYEEVLKGVPDDARVSLTCQEGGEPIVYVGSKESQLVWSEQMLLMKSAEPARKQHSDVTRIHMLLMPTDRISSVEVSYDVDTDDLLEVTNTESQGVSQPLTFEELDLDESEYESLFGDGSPTTGSAFSFGASSSMSNLPAHGRAFSSYDENGLFVNCFHLRNTAAWERNHSYHAYGPCLSYRKQWEPYVGRFILCEGTLTKVVSHGHCLQLVVDDVNVKGIFCDAISCVRNTRVRNTESYLREIPNYRRSLGYAKSQPQPVDGLTVFVSSDYEVPPIGNKLQIRGQVYAYPLKSKTGLRKQLGLNVMAIG